MNVSSAARVPRAHHSESSSSVDSQQHTSRKKKKITKFPDPIIPPLGILPEQAGKKDWEEKPPARIYGWKHFLALITENVNSTQK